MLPRVNRVIRPADFRAAVRRGRRVGSEIAVIHVLRGADGVPPRAGFLVTKAVGNAVTRNLIKRRMRAIIHETLAELPLGTDVVVRALPASAQASWATLHNDITEGISMGMARQ
ncbi:MAG: ribonuclease P protein component [Rhodoglobus sp.]